MLPIEQLTRVRFANAMAGDLLISSDEDGKPLFLVGEVAGDRYAVALTGGYMGQAVTLTYEQPRTGIKLASYSIEVDHNECQDFNYPTGSLLLADGKPALNARRERFSQAPLLLSLETGCDVIRNDSLVAFPCWQIVFYGKSGNRHVLYDSKDARETYNKAGE